MAGYFLLEEKAAGEGRESPVAQVVEQMGIINCKSRGGNGDSIRQAGYTLCNTLDCL